MQAIRFQADDGFELRGQLYGDRATAKAALLIAPAMGVSQRYYADFAQWLVGQGFVVMSFDYRGMGSPRPPPVALPLFRYFPGRMLKKVGDLPKGVMAQWRRWCLHRDYLMGEGGRAWRERYAAMRTPILSLSFTDDEYMSAHNTASLHSFYSNAPREMRRIAPAEVGLKTIGHFGFFRQHASQALWPQVPQWLAS